MTGETNNDHFYGVGSSLCLDLHQLVSNKGTVRGIKDRVRSSVFNRNKQLNTFASLEEGKVIIYATTVSIVRHTFEQCNIVKKILQNHRLRYELRDVSIGKQYQQELSERLEMDEPTVPQVFAGGIWLGDANRIQSLNEAGELTNLLVDYPKIEHVSFYCDHCGGFRYVPCPVCKGTKKSAKVETTLTRLKCMNCDKKGLVRCSSCEEQQE